MQKSYLGILATLVFLISGPAWPDNQSELQERLNRVNSFSASFMQRVTTADGELVQDGEGVAWLKRPARFRWETTKPDKNLLVSDGETVWFYTPEVEQVSATWLRETLSQSVLALITRNDSSDWKRYKVVQRGDLFEVTPKSGDEDVKFFALIINRHGVIKQFATTETDGQQSIFIFQQFRQQPLDDALFLFTPPPGVTIDDHRQ